MRAKRSGDGKADDWTAASVEAAAVGLLARREHSRAELSRKLADRGVPGELMETVLDALAERGLQSDARYAEALFTSRIGRRHGPARIRRELQERGVSAAIAEAALEAAEVDWFELAREARRRRFGDTPPAEWNERVRQSRFLEYRGFTSDQVRFALGREHD